MTRHSPPGGWSRPNSNNREMPSRPVMECEVIDAEHLAGPGERSADRVGGERKNLLVSSASSSTTAAVSGGSSTQV